MEIFWLCEQCDSTNNYENTKVCSVCGEKITPKSEEKCIYELAEQLHENAVTSAEFFAACEQYLKVLSYKDAREKHSDCKFKAEKTLMNEKAYAEAKQCFKVAEEYSLAEKWEEAICQFNEAMLKFQKIVNFSDAKMCALSCQREAELCQSKQVYFKAKKILSSATSVEDYKKAAELFSKISKFADAKDNYDLCLKFIAELNAKQQLEEIKEAKRSADEETNLDKKIEQLKKIISLEASALSEEAKRIILQCKPLLEQSLAQKKAIQTKQDFEVANEKYNDTAKISDYTSRLYVLEKILSEYKDYSQTAGFSVLFENCKKDIADAKKNIDYSKALDMMNNARTSTDFKKASEAFAALSGFKDADAKKNECSENSDVLAKETTYNCALETYEKGRKITIFNWKKYL